MKTFKVVNTFHNTSAAFRAPADYGEGGREVMSHLDGRAHNGDAAAGRKLKRIYRKLCGIKACRCGGMIADA